MSQRKVQAIITENYESAQAGVTVKFTRAPSQEAASMNIGKVQVAANSASVDAHKLVDQAFKKAFPAFGS